MSDQQSSPGNATKFLFPLLFLAVIAILSLYIVRDNYNQSVSHPLSEVNKDTRSDYTRIKMEAENEENMPTNKRTDSSGRERASQPEIDNTKSR